MKQDLGNIRIRRLKVWIACLTMVPSAVALIAGKSFFALGFIAGGGLVFLNLLGTEHSVRMFIGLRGWRLFLAALLYIGKLFITAAVIGLIILFELASTVALVLGLSMLLAAVVLDFIFFQVNLFEKGGLDGR